MLHHTVAVTWTTITLTTEAQETICAMMGDHIAKILPNRDRDAN